MLKREDINEGAHPPYIRVRQGKTPGNVLIRSDDKKVLAHMLKNGVKSTRIVKHKHGPRIVNEHFSVPANGFLFKARQDFLGVHTV